MSTCADVRPLLDLAPLDLLEPEERLALENHTEGCGACRAQLAALGAALAADRAAVEEETLPMSSSLRDRLVTAVSPATDKKPGPGPLAVDPARVDEVGRRIALSCSYCHDRTPRDEVAFCAACLAPHHAECFATHGRCALPGCEETAVVRPQAAATSPPRRRRRRVGLWVGLTAASVVGTIAAFEGFGPNRFRGYTPLLGRALEETRRAADELEEAVRAGDGVRARELRAKLELAPWLQEAITEDGPEGREALRRHLEALRARADALLGDARVTLDLQDVDVRVAVDQLARQAGQNVIVDPAVQEKVTVSLRDVLWTEALRAIASMAQCRIEPLGGGVLSVFQPPRVTIQFTDANIRTVIQLLAAYSGKNVVMDAGVDGQLTMNFQEVPWDEALLGLAAAHRFHVSVIGDVIVCSKEPRGGRPLTRTEWTGDSVSAPDDGARVDVSASARPLGEVMASIARQSGQRVEVRGLLDARVTADLRQVPWRAAVEAIVSTTPRAELVDEDGALVVRARPENRLRAVRAPAAEWLQLLASLADVDLVLPATLGRERVSLELSDIDPLSAIEATARTLGWQLERANDLVRILTPPGQGSTPPRARTEPSGLRLEATVTSGERAWAIISGRIYASGDTLLDAADREVPGLVLEAVRPDSVTLRRGGEPQVLELAQE